MEELEFDGKKYLSSKRAAEVTGYAKDYVGQLCREGRVDARLVGRAWYVSEDSIREHRFGEEEKEEVIVPEVEELTPTHPISEEESFPAWNTASYSTEVIDVIPTLSARTSAEVVQEDSERTSPVLHMQSVWQDWFDNRNRTEEDAVEEVPITRIEEEETREEEVPIYRIPMRESAPAPVVRREMAHEEVRAPVQRAPKQVKGSSGFLTQVILIATMLILVSVTLVSMGYGVSELDLSNNPFIGYISGISK